MLANADDTLQLRHTITREEGVRLPSPVNISFELSETTTLPEIPDSNLPASQAQRYVKSTMTVDTDGLNRIELKLRDGRKVAFEFRVQR